MQLEMPNKTGFTAIELYVRTYCNRIAALTIISHLISHVSLSGKSNGDYVHFPFLFLWIILFDFKSVETVSNEQSGCWIVRLFRFN